MSAAIRVVDVHHTVSLHLGTAGCLWNGSFEFWVAWYYISFLAYTIELTRRDDAFHRGDYLHSQIQLSLLLLLFVDDSQQYL